MQNKRRPWYSTCVLPTSRVFSCVNWLPILAARQRPIVERSQLRCLPHLNGMLLRLLRSRGGKGESGGRRRKNADGKIVCAFLSNFRTAISSCKPCGSGPTLPPKLDRLPLQSTTSFPPDPPCQLYQPRRSMVSPEFPWRVEAALLYSPRIWIPPPTIFMLEAGLHPAA